ncbi:MAG: ankyrin repeat protein [Streptosporangiaceae bacterium]|jgi:hypothetical protein|nr:ankyrin repeat protein [Streptosporangiaceae bacterium]
MDRLETYFDGAAPPAPADVDRAFWGACHGGRQDAAVYLLERGAQSSVRRVQRPSRPAVGDTPGGPERNMPRRACQGTGTARRVTGPRVGFSSSDWDWPAGVITSMALGTVAGSREHSGPVPPEAQTPNW